MPRSYSRELLERVVGFVGLGNSCHAASRIFLTSPSFVINLINLMKQFRVTGSVEPRRRGSQRPGKLAPHRDFLLRRVEETPDVRAARVEWVDKRQPSWGASRNGLSLFMVCHLDAIGSNPMANGSKTNMARPRGRSKRGQRLKALVPFGHWKSETFIAGLRCYGPTAPWVIDGPMNRSIFETWVETQLSPTLSKGDVVILDNLPAHKSRAAADILKEKGGLFLFLPPYCPTSTPSKWLSQNSRRNCEKSLPEPSVRSGTQSDKSATSSHPKNAETASRKPDKD